MMNDKNEGMQKYEVDLDVLENITGGASNGESDAVDGTVVGYVGNGVYTVDIGGGQTVNAHLSGKMRMCLVRVMIGDKVRVEVQNQRVVYKYRQD